MRPIDRVGMISVSPIRMVGSAISGWRAAQPWPGRVTSRKEAPLRCRLPAVNYGEAAHLAGWARSPQYGRDMIDINGMITRRAMIAGLAAAAIVRASGMSEQRMRRAVAYAWRQRLPDIA